MIVGMEGRRLSDPVRDRRIERAVELVAPEVLFEELSLGDERTAAVVRGREQVSAVLDREDDEFPISNAFGISSVPTVFLIERDGTISRVIEGWVKKDIESLGAIAGVLWLLPSPVLRLRELPEVEE